MQPIKETKRLSSPAKLPQSLAWDGSHFWMGSMDTNRIYQIDPKDWKVVWETEAPGTPFGITSIEDELRVLCGETEEDYRIIRRCIPGEGMDMDFILPCPDDTGSQLGYDGKNLHLSQWYNQQVLTLSFDGSILKTTKLLHGICGQVFVDDYLYLLTTDNEESGQYWITRVGTGERSPIAEDLAIVPFRARSLTFDGKHFWTNHREKNETVCFSID